MLAVDATFADIQAEIAACSGYETDATGDLGRRFLAAGRRLLAGGLPSQSMQGQSSVQFDLGRLAEMVETCRLWLVARRLLTADDGINAGARTPSFRNFRGGY